MSTVDHNWVRLGDYIVQCDERNSQEVYGIDDVRGVKNTKGFMKTKADISQRDLSTFRILKPESFAFNRRTTRNGERLGLGYNDTNNTLICTEDYIVFKIMPELKSVLDSCYLYICFLRDEFDRYTRYDSWGSATEFFNWDEMCRVKIPLPSIETQRELVTLYKGLKNLAEQNEAMLKPLSDACQAFIVDCKKKYQAVKLGDYIELFDKRNSDNKIKAESVRGISTDKTFIDTKANLDGVSLTSYKIVSKKEFAYVPDTSRRGEKIALALNNCDDNFLISSIYSTFRCNDNQILSPEFLFLLISHSEFDRYSRYNSWGSARETFDWDEMCRVEIPLPPIEVQQSIVSLYTCYEECKRIAKESREQLKNICPALVQKAGEC